MRGSEKNGPAVQSRVPKKGDVLEFEMAEPSAPDGVEWLPGTVLKVNLNKKTFTALIKEDEDDESTWNEEAYKVSVICLSRALKGMELILLFFCVHVAAWKG